MERSKLMKLTAEELLKLAEEDTSKLKYDRYEVYKAAFEKYKDKYDLAKVEDIKKELLLLDLSVKSYPNDRFHSKMSGTTEKGDNWKYPDLNKDFSEETINYYKMRAKQTNNPILKSRYCDFIWEYKQEYEFSLLAIKSYLDCVSIYYENMWNKYLADSLDRALTISVQINNEELSNKCLARHYIIIKNLYRNKRYNFLIEIIESIIKRGKKLEEDIKFNDLITTIEAVISDYSQEIPEGFEIQRNYLYLLNKIWSIKNDEEKYNETLIRIADLYVEEAEWTTENYPKGNMVSTSLYEEAMKIYIELEDFSNQVDELKVKIQEANIMSIEKGEYETISTESEIPRKTIDEYIQKYKNENLNNIFKMISVDNNLLPSYEEAKNLAVENKKEFVLQYLLPVSIMKGSICVKRIKEDDEKLEYNTICNFQQNCKFVQDILLNKIFDVLQEKDEKFLDKLIDVLPETGLITNKRVNIIKHGFKSYQNKEYLAAIHIIIFQIEGILRDLLGKLRLPTFSYKNNEMRNRMLYDILNTLSKVEGFDIDFIKLIEVYLNDIRAFNFRNEIAHGLILNEDVFTKSLAQVLIFILIKISSYSVSRRT